MKRIKITSLIIAIMVLCSLTLVDVSAAAAVTTLNDAIKYTGAELKDPIDGMWQGFKTNNDNGGALESNQDGIEGDGTKLTLKGYNAGANAQYAYVDMNALHNKMIRFKLKFDGEFYDPEASFITFVFRSASFSSKMFWDESCYTLLLKGGKVEANKYPATYQGTNNQLGGSKGNIPLLKKLEKPFTPGTYELEVGALDGTSPASGKESVNLVMKINGKEVINVWDDTGRTPIIKRKGYFMVSLCATQTDNGSKDSRSSVTIYPVEAVKETGTKETAAAEQKKSDDKTEGTAAASTTDTGKTDDKTTETTAAVTETTAAETMPAPEATEPAPTTAETESQTTGTEAKEAAATTAASETEKADESITTVDKESNIPVVVAVIAVVVVLGAIGFVFLRKRKR